MSSYNEIKQDFSDSFNKVSFQSLCDELAIQGYIFSFFNKCEGKFAHLPIQYLDQKLFQELCNKFNIIVPFSIKKAGRYFPEHSNMFIVYNESMVDSDKATMLLEKAVTNIDQ